MLLFSPLLINPDSQELHAERDPYKHYIVMNVAPLLIGSRTICGRILLDIYPFLIVPRPLIIPINSHNNLRIYTLSFLIFKMMMIPKESVIRQRRRPFQVYDGISFIIDDRCRNFLNREKT